MSDPRASKSKHGSPGCTCTTCHVAKRRSHKKSRNGCQNCKRRRIKCDEAKPECGQCLKASILCGFANACVSLDSLESSGASNGASSGTQARKRGRPRKDWDAIFKRPDPVCIDPALSDVSAYSTPGSSGMDLDVLVPDILPSSSWIWTVEDLELQHHWMTSKDLCPGDSALWREKVPVLAFSNHCVLHLLLATSALHMARERPDESSRYEDVAEGHYSVGLRQVMEIMPNINKDNCGTLYISSSLVCYYSFAKKPSPGHLLVISDGEEVAWVELLRGVRIVVETMGWNAIFSGVLGPPPSERSEPEPRDEVVRTRDRKVEWETAMAGISRMISASEDQDTETYKKQLEDVTECFRQTFGNAEEPKYNVDGVMQVIIGCVYRMEEEFVQCLRDKKTTALLLLAHLAVPLKTLEWMWFMRGWASHILHGVALMLGPGFGEYLRWPREEIARLAEERRSHSSCSPGPV
ncbi:C6 finger domain-containing protein [Colletotrichum musicola]|uniref:C6 finger domain-containing protein n=1 Tax=Colletotrichum musicola TaxID=2175873 RepID=A0A8H6U756_9PEZI|nr:C6 finger domain-containing protein [Colletotrichum musicola]